jgi:cell division protein FtsQ
MKRQRAFRVAAWLAALAIIALPLVAAMNGWLAADRWPFRQLGVTGAFRQVSIEQVRTAAAAELKPGYFAVDLEKVRARVSALTWIEHVEVRKHWPDRIDIAIIEREPIALWGDDRLLSASGDLFSVPAGAIPEGLPRFIGPDALRGQIRDFYREALRTLGPTDLVPTGAVLTSRGAWTLPLSNGGEMLLGREQAAERLARFAAVFKQLSAAQLSRLQRADLRHENGFALRWEPLPSLDTAPEQTLPPSDALHPPTSPMAPAAVVNEPART